MLIIHFILTPTGFSKESELETFRQCGHVGRSQEGPKAHQTVIWLLPLKMQNLRQLRLRAAFAEKESQLKLQKAELEASTKLQRTCIEVSLDRVRVEKIGHEEHPL